MTERLPWVRAVEGDPWALAGLIVAGVALWIVFYVGTVAVVRARNRGPPPEMRRALHEHAVEEPRTEAERIQRLREIADEVDGLTVEVTDENEQEDEQA